MLLGTLDASFPPPTTTLINEEHTTHTHTLQVPCPQQGLQSSERHFSPWTMNDDKRVREWQREIMGEWWCWVTSQITHLNRLCQACAIHQGLVSEKSFEQDTGKMRRPQATRGQGPSFLLTSVSQGFHRVQLRELSKCWIKVPMENACSLLMDCKSPSSCLSRRNSCL